MKGSKQAYFDKYLAANWNNIKNVRTFIYK